MYTVVIIILLAAAVLLIRSGIRMPLMPCSNYRKPWNSLKIRLIPGIHPNKSEYRTQNNYY